MGTSPNHMFVPSHSNGMSNEFKWKKWLPHLITIQEYTTRIREDGALWLDIMTIDMIYEHELHLGHGHRQVTYTVVDVEKKVMKCEGYTLATWTRTAHGKLLLPLEKACNNCMMHDFWPHYALKFQTPIRRAWSGTGRRHNWWIKVGSHPVTPKGRLAFVNKETAQFLQYFSCLDIIHSKLFFFDNLNSILMPIAQHLWECVALASILYWELLFYQKLWKYILFYSC